MRLSFGRLGGLGMRLSRGRLGGLGLRLSRGRLGGLGLRLSRGRLGRLGMGLSRGWLGGLGVNAGPVRRRTGRGGGEGGEGQDQATGESGPGRARHGVFLSRISMRRFSGLSGSLTLRSFRSA